MHKALTRHGMFSGCKSMEKESPLGTGSIPVSPYSRICFRMGDYRQRLSLNSLHFKVREKLFTSIRGLVVIRE